MATNISERAFKACTSMEDFGKRWSAALHKQLEKMENMERELLDFDQETVSVGGQLMLIQEMEKLKTIFQAASDEHKQIHSAVSRCGRVMDRFFVTDLNGVMKNQKDIDNNPECFEKVNKMIFDHLLGLGRIDVASTFMKESELQLEWPKECDVDLIQKVMGPLRVRNYMPAIEWVSKNIPENRDLLFRLHRQYMLQLVLDGKKMEAIGYARNMQTFADQYSDEIRALMFVAVQYPQVGKHKNLFLDGVWLELEEQLAKALCPSPGALATLLDVGAQAVPSLIRIKPFGRDDSFVNELPIEINIPTHVHSTFTCPILKTQTTESNLPKRLQCGHVISSEAIERICQHNRKLKCPYCPQECPLDAVKNVYF